MVQAVVTQCLDSNALHLSLSQPWLRRCLLCYQIVSVESPEAALGHLQSSAWGLEGHAEADAELSGMGLHLLKRHLCCLHPPDAHGGLCVGFELTATGAKVLAGCNSGVQPQGPHGGFSLPASGLRALFMPNQQQHSPGTHLANHNEHSQQQMLSPSSVVAVELH